MVVGWIILGFVVFFGVVGLVLYFLSIYNNLIMLNKDIDKSWANIDVLLKQRYDELPKLVATCKGYMTHEKTVLEEITRARSLYTGAKTLGEKATADNALTGALKTLFAVSENYPQLKANENFLNLQTRISSLENELADRREFYNDSVNTYNIRINQIPYNFVAGSLKYTDKTLFKAAPEETKDVKIEF